MRELHDHVITLVSPFDQTGAVDLEAARAVVRYTSELPGCGGLYFGSVYQEFWALSLSERLELMAVMIEEGRPRRPMVVGVSAAALPDSLTLVDRATSAGADYLMVWPPIFGPRDERGVTEFYRRVFERTDLPCFVYSTHLEELGYFLTPRTIEALAEEFPHLYGVKDGSGNVTSFLELTRRFGERLRIGTPFEEYWILAKQAYGDLAADFLLGSSRAMYMQSPDRPILADAMSYLRKGDMTAAFAKLAEIADLVDLQMESFARGVHPVALAKFVLSVQGGWSGSVRPPTPPLDESTQTAVLDALRRIGLVETDGGTPKQAAAIG